MTALLGEDGQLAAIESFWGDHGGMPLRKIHRAQSFPSGSHRVDGDELRVGPVFLRQEPERLGLWFSAGTHLPRAHWVQQQDTATGVTIWLSNTKVKAGWPVPAGGDQAECPMLAGLVIDFARTTAIYPIESLNFAAEDFK